MMQKQSAAGEVRFGATILSPGVAWGRLCYIEGELSGTEAPLRRRVAEVDREIERFERQVATVIEELRGVAELLGRESYADEQEIIQSHIFMLEDRVFRARVRALIEDQRVGAEVAVEYVLRETIEMVERSESAALASRASDLRDVLLRLRMKLREEDELALEEATRGVERPVVMLRELLPSRVLAARRVGVAAILVEQGTSLSHAAIMARAFGIPVLRLEGLPREKLAALPEVQVDGLEGRLVLNPRGGLPPAGRHAPPRAQTFQPVSGPVRLWLNVTDPLRVERQVIAAADGVGLYRSELLFLQGDRAPTEEEQEREYASLFHRFAGRPVTIRTLDIGADKSVPYLSLGPQENPFLGLRAHRLYRFHPELLHSQVRAILKAAGGEAKPRVLLPMIETVDELLFVLGLLDRAAETLQGEGLAYRPEVPLGLLIEVPSAVWNLPALLPHVDFLSVGTNDLLQYFFAVDRNNGNVSCSYQPEDPGALRMLRRIVRIAEEAGKPLSMCGELASDPVFLPLLVGLGYRHFSVDPHVLESHAARVRELDLRACELLADRCLAASRGQEVRELLAGAGGGPARSRGRTDAREDIDPVCGMVVHTTGNRLAVARHGRTYFFCSEQCRVRFLHGDRLRPALQPVGDCREGE